MVAETEIPGGLVIIRGQTIEHVHTTDGEKDLDRLREYLDEWDLDVPTSE